MFFFLTSHPNKYHLSIQKKTKIQSFKYKTESVQIDLSRSWSCLNYESNSPIIHLNSSMIRKSPYLEQNRAKYYQPFKMEIEGSQLTVSQPNKLEPQVEDLKNRCHCCANIAFFPQSVQEPIASNNAKTKQLQQAKQLANSCHYCKKLTCQACQRRCSGCRYLVCNFHVQTDPVSGEPICQDCFNQFI